MVSGTDLEGGREILAWPVHDLVRLPLSSELKPKIVPRNDIHWLGDSVLLAKLTLSPRHSKWLRRRVLCDISSASDWTKTSQSSR